MLPESYFAFPVNAVHSTALQNKLKNPKKVGFDASFTALGSKNGTDVSGLNNLV